MSGSVGVFIREPALVAVCGEADLPPVGAMVEVVHHEGGNRIVRWLGGQADLRDGVGLAVVSGVVERVRPLRLAAPGTAWILHLER